MTSKNPLKAVDIATVELSHLVDNDLSEERFTATIEGDTLYGPLTYYKNLKDGERQYGWYRVTKTPGTFYYEGFQGEDRDELHPLWATALPLGEMLVEADSTFELFSMLFPDRKEPEAKYPTPVGVVFRWIYDQQSASLLRMRYAPLFEQVEDLHLFSAGGMCPFQAEGTIAGLPFYFRYRGDLMSLRVAQTYEDIWEKPLYLASQEYGDGDGYGGSLGDEEFMEQFVLMVKSLTKASMLWRFEGVVTEDYEHYKKGQKSDAAAWGNTPEEAWERLQDFSYHAPEHLDMMRKFREVQGLSPVSVSVDDRVFPQPEPDFQALVKE